MNWGHRVHQRGRSDEDYHRDACIATRCHAMKSQKKLATRYQYMKTLLFENMDCKTSISRTYTLIPQKANT